MRAYVISTGCVFFVIVLLHGVRVLFEGAHMLRDPGYHLNLRLDPGCLIAYNNNRVLHGRASFDPTTGERHLQGCYLNLEDLQSKLRLLDRAQA